MASKHDKRSNTQSNRKSVDHGLSTETYRTEQSIPGLVLFLYHFSFQRGYIYPRSGSVGSSRQTDRLRDACQASDVTSSLIRATVVLEVPAERGIAL
jgi:hypothetical protein